jgi:hypothetical protein
MVLALSHATAQEGTRRWLGLGLGQDYGGVGVQLNVVPEDHICLAVGAGLLPGAQFGYNVGIQITPVPSWKDPLFICGMYGYTTVLYDRDESGVLAVSQLIGVRTGTDLETSVSNGFTFGLGTRIHAKDSESYWKLAVLFPLRTGATQRAAESLGMMSVTVSVGYHFSLN